jgi:undecaprenyl-diphosphatase
VSLEGLAAALLDPGIPPLVIYATLFAGCVLESFFPPWPADLVALYTGVLAGRGVLDPRAVLAVAIAGTQAGVMGAFWVSRRWGRALLQGPLGRYLPVSRLGQLERWFDRWGASAIAVSRFFPGVRALVTPAAGVAGLSAWKVWVFAGTSVVIWNVLVVGAGLFTGLHLDDARTLLVRYNAIAGGVVVAGLLGGGVLLLRRWLARVPAGPGRPPGR